MTVQKLEALCVKANKTDTLQQRLQSSRCEDLIPPNTNWLKDIDLFQIGAVFDQLIEHSHAPTLGSTSMMLPNIKNIGTEGPPVQKRARTLDQPSPCSQPIERWLQQQVQDEPFVILRDRRFKTMPETYQSRLDLEHAAVNCGIEPNGTHIHVAVEDQDEEASLF
jgi:hypothetical protein